jgi:hypothetical protein
MSVLNCVILVENWIPIDGMLENWCGGISKIFTNVDSFIDAWKTKYI